VFCAVHVLATVAVQIGGEHDTYQWIPFGDLPKYTNYDVLLRMCAYVTDNHLLEAVHDTNA
jgi:hypothetical protein